MSPRKGESPGIFSSLFYFMKVMFLINAGVGDCGGDDDVGNVVTREHDVGDHADAPEVGVQGQGLVVHHLVASSMIYHRQQSNRDDQHDNHDHHHHAHQCHSFYLRGHKLRRSEHFPHLRNVRFYRFCFLVKKTHQSIAISTLLGSDKDYF